jgi:hypothetical protein
MRHRDASALYLAAKCLVTTTEEQAALFEERSNSSLFDIENLAAFGNAPFRVRLADRLADAMWAIEEALAMCELEDQTCRDTWWIEPDLRSTYEQVNCIMKTISN